MKALAKLKEGVETMSVARIQEAADAQLPFNRAHFNTCFAEIEALFQRAGYHKALDVVGYQEEAYAMFDPNRWDPVAVLRGLRDDVESKVAS
jgi:hypothetical protein